MGEDADSARSGQLWFAVAYLAILVFGTLIIGFGCSGNPRWNIGD